MGSGLKELKLRSNQNGSNGEVTRALTVGFAQPSRRPQKIEEVLASHRGKHRFSSISRAGREGLRLSVESSSEFRNRGPVAALGRWVD